MVLTHGDRSELPLNVSAGGLRQKCLGLVT